MPKHFHVASFYHGGFYSAELIAEESHAYLVKITGWYPFSIKIWFRKAVMRNGAMVLEIN